MATKRKPRRATELGVDDDTYAALLEAQGGYCALPGCLNTAKTRRLHTDHDHKTGATRGLLCYYHNKFMPRTLALARAYVEYLEAWS